MPFMKSLFQPKFRLLGISSQKKLKAAINSIKNIIRAKGVLNLRVTHVD